MSKHRVRRALCKGMPACISVCVCVYDVRWSARVSISSKVNGSISYIILSLLIVDGGGDLLRASGGERSEFSKTQYPPPTPWHRHKEAYLTHTRSVITIIHDRPDVTYKVLCVCMCGVTIAFFHTRRRYPPADSCPYT